jgi:cobyrinic acid a,c-diamide synthase
MRTLSGFVIAGTHSGVGKTTVSLGIMAALRHRGLKVQPFKVGPDFIDPGLHSKICGLPSYNLDGWMLSQDYNASSFQRNVRNADVAIVEGVMGLYDGHSGSNEIGSTAEIANHLKLPVILVLDAATLARSAAAMILGYCRFDPKLSVIGVIFNRVAGAGHLRYLRDALKSLREVQCFGGLLRDDKVKIPERHLGLTVAEENVLDPPLVGRLRRLIEDNIDLDRLLRRTRINVSSRETQTTTPSGEHEHVSIAVARDKAFCFYYPDNLESLRSAGAKLELFSPMADRRLPTATKGIYLGGGYPELYARELSRNRSMRAAVSDFIEAGGAVYAECGGLMYLTEALLDGNDREYPMVGIYPFKTRMLPSLRSFGYREIVFKRTGFLSGGRARGHEFHYSELKRIAGNGSRIQRAYAAPTQKRRESGKGYFYKNCLASYTHLHFGSNPDFAARFVEACKRT